MKIIKILLMFFQWDLKKGVQILFKENHKDGYVKKKC